MRYLFSILTLVILIVSPALAQNYTLNAFLKHDGDIKGVAFSADGRTLASMGTDRVVHYWNPHTEKRQPHAEISAIDRWSIDASVVPEEPHTLPVNTFDIIRQTISFPGIEDPDGLLASGSSDKTIWLQGFSNLRPLFRIQEQGKVWAVALSPDGRTLASGGDFAGIHLWDLTTISPVHGTIALKSTLAASTARVEGLAFSPDGQTLAVATGRSDGEAIHLWDLRTEQRTETLIAVGVPIKKVAFSPDGQMIAAGAGHTFGGRNVLLWKRGPLSPAKIPHSVEIKEPLLPIYEGHTRTFNITVKNIYGREMENIAIGFDDHPYELWKSTDSNRFDWTDSRGKTSLGLRFYASGVYDVPIKVLNRTTFRPDLSFSARFTVLSLRCGVEHTGVQGEALQWIADNSITVEKDESIIGGELSAGTVKGVSSKDASKLWAPENTVDPSDSSDSDVIITVKFLNGKDSQHNLIKSVIEGTFSYPAGLKDKLKSYPSAICPYILTWSDYAGVKFKFIASKTPNEKSMASDVRIIVWEKSLDEWSEFEAPGWSAVGRADTVLGAPESYPNATMWLNIPDENLEYSDVEDKPDITTFDIFHWYQNTDDYIDLILHEFGHMLGLKHEHQSPAATGVLKDRAQELKAEKEKEFEDGKITKDEYDAEIKSIDTNIAFLSADEYNYTEFDPDSIMLYPGIPYLTKEDEQPRDTGVNNRLSSLDGEYIQLLYPTYEDFAIIPFHFEGEIGTESGGTPKYEKSSHSIPFFSGVGLSPHDVKVRYSVKGKKLGLLGAFKFEHEAKVEDVRIEIAPAGGESKVVFDLIQTSHALGGFWRGAVVEVNGTIYVKNVSYLFEECVPLAPSLSHVEVSPQTALLANYPNPFNPETWMPYQLAKPAEVTLNIYAVDGKLIRTLALGHQAAGTYHSKARAAYWDGRNEFGERVASGLYFYTFTAGDFSATRKMLIMK